MRWESDSLECKAANGFLHIFTHPDLAGVRLCKLPVDTAKHTTYKAVLLQ